MFFATNTNNWNSLEQIIKETTKHDAIVLPGVGPFAEEARKKLQGHGSQSLLRGGIATDHQEIIDTVDADITDVGDAFLAKTR